MSAQWDAIAKVLEQIEPWASGPVIAKHVGMILAATPDDRDREVERIDVDRLARAMASVWYQADPNDDDRRTAEAFAAEYARLDAGRQPNDASGLRAALRDATGQWNDALMHRDATAAWQAGNAMMLAASKFLAASPDDEPCCEEGGVHQWVRHGIRNRFANADTDTGGTG